MKICSNLGLELVARPTLLRLVTFTFEAVPAGLKPQALFMLRFNSSNHGIIIFI